MDEAHKVATERGYSARIVLEKSGAWDSIFRDAYSTYFLEVFNRMTEGKVRKAIGYLRSTRLDENCRVLYGTLIDALNFTRKGVEVFTIEYDILRPRLKGKRHFISRKAFPA